MDFIERWFHISPDGGNGSLEFLYVAILILAITLMAIKRKSLFKLFLKYLEQLGQRESGDRFDS